MRGIVICNCLTGRGVNFFFFFNKKNEKLQALIFLRLTMFVADKNRVNNVFRQQISLVILSGLEN